MLHELEAHDDSIFITLTYSDDYISNNQSLSKSDLQKFFKRLRKNIYPKRIRYFACGEYGDKTQRPHYHSILFGMSLRKEDKQVINDSWTFGHVYYGLAEPDSINYVAQYIDKKFTGELAEIEYVRKNRDPVFRILSLGIGSCYVDSNSDQLKTDLCVRHKGKQMALPRYYVKRLGLSGTEALKEKALENDCEVTQKHTGLYMSAEELYRCGSLDDNKMLVKGVKASKKQHKANLEAKVAMKQSKL